MTSRSKHEPPQREVGNILESYPLVGTEITATTFEGALDTFEAIMETDSRTYACFCTVNMLLQARQDQGLRQAVDEAGIVVPDGMPLVRMGKKRASEPVGRVRAGDFVDALAERSQETGHRHYFYGGAEGVPEAMAKNLKERYPDLNVAGTYSPPFRPLTEEEDEKVVRRINESQASIVWVGLGCPKQEKWMHDHLGRIEAPIMAGVGAAFDFISGNKPEVPAPFKKNFEWLWRFITEPRRLWPRVIKEGPQFLTLLAKEELTEPLPTNNGER